MLVEQATQFVSLVILAHILKLELEAARLAQQVRLIQMLVNICV